MAKEAPVRTRVAAAGSEVEAGGGVGVMAHSGTGRSGPPGHEVDLHRLPALDRRRFLGEGVDAALPFHPAMPLSVEPIYSGVCVVDRHEARSPSLKPRQANYKGEPVFALRRLNPRTMAVSVTCLAIAITLATATPSHADTDLPKLGPNANSIIGDHAYLQTAGAPDYWQYSPFDKPQFTSSACSIASVTMALNGLRGLPPLASQKVLTQQRVLKGVGIPRWARESAEGGDGVTFAELRSYTRKSLDHYGMHAATMDVFKPTSVDDSSLARIRSMLTTNEQSASTVALIYFNQGVLTGDWNGPHISVIGAFDAATDRVLVLDVDQEWYIPYWSPVEALAQAFTKPAPKDQGVLAGQTGGIVLISR